MTTTNYTRTIDVFAREGKTKQDNKTFLYFRTNINGEWYEVKFTRNSKRPETKGIYHCTFDLHNVNIKENKEENRMDTLWIGSCELTPYTEDELFERKRGKLEKAFADKSTKTDDKDTLKPIDVSDDDMPY